MRLARTTSLLLLAGVLAAPGATVPGCRAPDGPAGPAGGPRFGRPAPRPLPRPVRGIWVARFHYRSPEDIRTILDNCARSGCNTVFWQVRGEGTVAYPSRLEPWSREYDFRDPGFDPLAIAVDEAHRRGLRIEAWVNVMPGWRGAQPPPLPGQLYNAHPDWFLADAAGRRQPLARTDPRTGRTETFYVILNPCLPEVRRHIAAVIDELVARYDVDGVHLDYVRYAWDGTPGAKRAYPRDARTLELYHRETGRHPDDDPAAWDHWRANQLTRLVAAIREVVDRRRRGATVTAAAWRNPQLGYGEWLQNAVAWLRAGLVDALAPMAYSAGLAQFESDIDAYRRLAGGGRRIVPGVGVYLHEQPEALRAQLQRCRAWGGDYALFSYESLFPTAGDRAAAPAERDKSQRLRQARRAVLSELAAP